MLRSQVRLLSGAPEFNKDFIGTFDVNIGIHDDYFDWETGSPKILDGPDIKYKLNKYGFRSKDFDEFNESDFNILFGGDSYTFGDSLPLECIYPTMLKDELSKTIESISCYNTAFNGSSIHQVVKNTLAFIRKYGNPDLIVLVFPISERGIIYDEKNNFFVRAMHELGWVINHPWISTKAKKRYYDGFNKQESLLLGIDMIHMLEDICELNGIKLIWTAYEMRDSAIYDQCNFRYFMSLDKHIHYDENLNINNLPYWNKAKDDVHHGADWHANLTKSLIKEINGDL